MSDRPKIAPNTGDEIATQIDRLLAARRSVRGYVSAPIEEQKLRQLFATAQRAPSWCNIQPWRVWLTAAPMTNTVREALVNAAKNSAPQSEIPFPTDYPEPYREHRRACGYALYGAMNIERGDKARRYDAWLRNYAIFDAPHLAVVTRHRDLGEYGTLDVGVWLGVLLATAASLNIATCPMASIASYPAPLREHLAIPEEQVILFGIALGSEDPTVPANACHTARQPVDDNVRFVGF